MAPSLSIHWPSNLLNINLQNLHCDLSGLEIQKLSHTAQAFLTGQGNRASEYEVIYSTYSGPLASACRIRGLQGKSSVNIMQEESIHLLTMLIWL